MNLPPKALQVLTLLKAELLSRIPPEPTLQPDPLVPMLEEIGKEKREKKPTTLMRHARLRGESWQRYKRKGGW